MEYKTLKKKESCGSHGSFGIHILVAGSNLPDLQEKQIWIAGADAVESIEEAIMIASIKTLPKTAQATKYNRELLDVFDEPIFVEEIPNGYCPKWCCNHLPWFIVTTKVGRIKIGHRKRVIHIEWTDTVITKTADELFEKEDTTKYDKIIHAWSIENAKRYINKIVNRDENET